MSTAYETQPHFVAYLDLLAGKHLIKSEEDESLNRMHSLLQVAKDSGAHSANAIFPKCKMKIFSDNIIIACRLTGNPAKDYSRILSAFMLVSAIQIVGLEMYHYLFRGAATVGNLFIDNVMVWGSALVRATDMEETESIYPRVLVDDALLEMLADDRDGGENFSKYSLARDADGKYYLDYLSAYFRLPHSAESAAFVGENQRYFRERLAGVSSPVLEKLQWQTAYLDRSEALARAAAQQAEERARDEEQQALVPCEPPRSEEVRAALEKAAEARAAAEKAEEARTAAARAAEKKAVAAKAARARSAVARTAGAKAAAAKAVEARATAEKAAATTEAVARTAEAAAAGTKARVAGAKAVAAEALRGEEKKRHRAERLTEREKGSHRDEMPEPEE